MNTPKWWPDSWSRPSGSPGSQPSSGPAWHATGDQADPNQPYPWPGPGIHITFPPPPPPPQESPGQQRDRERRAAVRRWLAVHGAAAGVGWSAGLKATFTAFLQTTGNGGVAAGLALAFFAYIGAEFATERFGRFLPRKFRPALSWAARIPFATALLATALHAPHALT